MEWYSSGKINKMNNLIDIKAAADILKLKSIYHARTLLGNPDDVEFTVNNKPKHLYSRCRVCALAQERVCLQCQRNNDRGKRSCYQCKRKFSKCELTSGICPECQAEKSSKILFVTVIAANVRLTVIGWRFYPLK